MPVLAPGEPLRRREPELLVENRLAPGRWLFELVVVDASGRESAPARLAVEVREGAEDRPALRDDLLRRRPVDPRDRVRRPGPVLTPGRGT